MKKLIFLLLILLPLAVSAFAEADIHVDGYDEVGEYAEQIISGKFPTPKEVIQRFADALFGEIVESKKLIAEIIAIAAFAGLISLMQPSSSGDAAYYTCYALMSAAVIRLLTKTAGYAVEVICGICDFITKLAPVLLGLMAASGSVTSAAAFSPVLSGAVYVFSLFTERFITPLIYLSAILAIAGNISGRVSLAGLNRLLRSVIKWVLTALLTIFTGLCALYGFNAPVLDAVGAKAVKFAVGSLVPVVGGLLADATDTVLGGTRILKNAVGSAGMLCIISAAAVPVIKLWVILFMLRLSAALSEPICDKRMSSMLTDAAGSVSMLCSVLLTAVMLFLITIGIMLGVGSAG